MTLHYWTVCRDFTETRMCCEPKETELWSKRFCDVVGVERLAIMSASSFVLFASHFGSEQTFPSKFGPPTTPRTGFPARPAAGHELVPDFVVPRSARPHHKPGGMVRGVNKREKASNKVVGSPAKGVSNALRGVATSPVASIPAGGNSSPASVVSGATGPAPPGPGSSVHSLHPTPVSSGAQSTAAAAPGPASSVTVMAGGGGPVAAIATPGGSLVVGGVAGPAGSQEAGGAVLTSEYVAREEDHGVNGVISCTMRNHGESLSVSVLANGYRYQGELKAEPSVREVTDVQDAYQAISMGSAHVSLDKLRLTGTGFKVKLHVVNEEQLSPAQQEQMISDLEAELERLNAVLQAATRCIAYVVPREELLSFGWDVTSATAFTSEGQVPEDDICWRGSYQGTVRALLWCGRVMLEGQVTGVGPGMRKYAERSLGNTAFSEVLFPLFRLPTEYRPRRVESFSRRPLHIGSKSSDLIGGQLYNSTFFLLSCILHKATSPYRSV
eukprot:g31016.t1